MPRLGQLATAHARVARPSGRVGPARHIPGPPSALRRGGGPAFSALGRPRSSAVAPCAPPTRSSRCFAAWLKSHPAWPSHLGSCFRQRTIAGGPWSRIPGPPQRSALPRQDPRRKRLGRLYGDGGVLELLLLAGALNQLAGRHRSHPAAQRGPHACSGFIAAREDEEAFDRCRNWLGPHQPGVNAPDPTEEMPRRPQPQEPPRLRRHRPGRSRDGPVLDYLLGP